MKEGRLNASGNPQALAREVCDPKFRSRNCPPATRVEHFLVCFAFGSPGPVIEVEDAETRTLQLREMRHRTINMIFSEIGRHCGAPVVMGDTYILHYPS